MILRHRGHVHSSSRRSWFFTEFPPRLPSQPIFYPVTNEEYATQITRDWNTGDEASGYQGYVTRFEVDAEFLAHYDLKRVGGAIHEEFPATDRGPETR